MMEQAYHEVQDSIKQLSQKLKHPITLVAVSKYHDSEKIDQLYQLGQRHFAENRDNELCDKANQLSHLNIIWHFIGKIQSRKIKIIAKYASWVQALESTTHAIKLNDNRCDNQPPLNVLIEVKVSHDTTKHGVSSFDEVLKLADTINSQPRLKLRGLMTMASMSDDQTLIQNEFNHLKQMFDQLNKLGYNLDTLSMGTSRDYKLAIKCGATMVRVGSQIFTS